MDRLALVMAAAADLRSDRFDLVTVSFNKQRRQYHQNNADKSVFGDTFKKATRTFHKLSMY